LNTDERPPLSSVAAPIGERMGGGGGKGGMEPKYHAGLQGGVVKGEQRELLRKNVHEQERELLRKNVHEIRCTVAQMEARCVGMEPDPPPFDALAKPPKGKINAERIRDLFGKEDERAMEAVKDMGRAVVKADELGALLDNCVQESSSLIRRCAMVNDALKEQERMQRHQDLQTRASIMTRTRSLRDPPSSCDAETQYEKQDKQTGPQKYWNEGFELELQAISYTSSAYTELNLISLH